MEDAAAALADHLAASGLMLRGGFNFAPDDPAPLGPEAKPSKAVLLMGHAGSSFWPHFSQWLAAQPTQMKNPLDAWSRLVIGQAAQNVGALAVFPSDRPYLPFQQWAVRVERLRHSPLGLLMHPRFGLWHAYRCALLFDRPLITGELVAASHHCDACLSKPCLHACPTGAASQRGLAYEACASCFTSGAGQSCMERGCAARNACPFGAGYRYTQVQQAFHMAAIRTT